MENPKRLQQVDADCRAGKIEMAHSSRGRPAVFLDRDGTLNVEKGGVRRADELELIPGVAEALIALRHAGFCLVVLTNQSAIARGQASEGDLGRCIAAWNGAGQGGRLSRRHLCLPASS